MASISQAKDRKTPCKVAGGHFPEKYPPSVKNFYLFFLKSRTV